MKRFAIILLSLLLVCIPVLAACTEQPAQESSEAAVSETSAETSKEEGTPFPLETKNFGGQTIRILTRNNESNTQFVPNEETEGTVISQAVLDRNQYIEEHFGLTLETEVTGTPAVEIGTYIESNLDDYDIVCDALCRMLPSITQNYFYSLNDWLDLKQPWWDQQANEYLTLSDKIFFVTGDAMYTDDLHTSCILFNKNEYNKYFAEQYGSLYEIVDRKEWTYDLMSEMAKAYSQPDDAGNWTNTDCRYGIVTDGYTGASQLVTGSGVLTVSKDNNGELKLHVGDEQSINAFDKVYNIMNDTTQTMYVEQLTADTKWNDIAAMFTNNKALFRIGYVISLLSLKNEENPDKVDPGIVPIPKFTKEQDEYFDGVNIYQCEVLGIPVSNVAHREATCYMLEALGYFSSNYGPFKTNSVSYAVYDTTLKLQSVTADDDSRMMDYILSHRMYDLGGIFDWGGGLTGVYSFCLYGGSNNLVSKWDGMKSAVELAMNETITAYKESIA